MGLLTLCLASLHSSDADKLLILFNGGPFITTVKDLLSCKLLKASSFGTTVTLRFIGALTVALYIAFLDPTFVTVL